VHHGLYLEAVVSSIASAVALAEVGRFREAVQYVQRAAKALYEGAKDVFEHVKITVQRLVELFVEAVARVLAWIDKHKAYLFLMAAVAAGVIALSAALNMWGMIELEKLACAASAPFVAGLADAGGKAAERFRTLAERYEKWKDEKVINEIINVPLKGERPHVAFLKLVESRRGLPKPLAELREALVKVEDEAERDAAVVAALVLYKALVKSAGAYKEWAELYRWARSLVEKQELTVAAGDIESLRGAHRRLEGAAEEVRRKLNAVLALYASHSRDLYEKLKPHLEVDVKKAEELAEASYKRFSDYSDAGMGTKAYAALLSIARGGLYGHAAMLLMGEGALADIVLLTPEGVYQKAWRIAKGRGEAVDPSRSPKGAANWEDRAASALLRYLLGRAVDEDLLFRRVEGGFEVFRAYGGVKVRVDVTRIGESATSSKAGKEVLRRFVEEAKEMAPDLSGMDKAPQYLEWRATDVSTTGKWIEAATAHPWQLSWYIALLGEEQSFSGGASVTKEGIKPNVTARWPRERENQILRESRWLESVLGQRVKNWRELMDAIDWSRVLERVEELGDELKPWIGPEGASDAEREGLVGRMLGELALLAHFAEARRKMDDGRWREARAKRLAKAVEALSGGRITGEYAERLAKLIVSYAESREERAKKRIDKLAEKLAGVPREEVWGIVEFVLGDMYCLARDCADDRIVRKFVAPALELVMLDKALSGKFSREEALLLFGEMYATAIAGDGSVEPGKVGLIVGGELGGGAALLRLATLLLLKELLPDELKFGVRIYIRNGRHYYITATGEDAARLMRLLAVSAPSAGGGYLSPKFEEFVEAARVEVQLDKNSIKLTDKGRVAAGLTLSVGDAAVKYNVYLRGDAIELEFHSSNRSRVELAARLLRLAGVSAEVKKKGSMDIWRVVATTDKLAAGREELRKALAEIVETARGNGWVDAGTAERWLEKLKMGRVLMEGWPKYHVGLSGGGALVIKFGSTSLNGIQREAQRLENMGLVKGTHFTVKMPKEGREGYVSILREGLAHAAFLSVYGKDKQQRSLAADFVKYILERAEEEGKEVSEKAQKIIEEGMSRSSQKLEDFEMEVEVNGEKYKVKVRGGGAVEEDRGGRKLLRIKITAEVGRVEGEHTIVDRVVREYTITYGRYGNNAARGHAYASAKAPGGRAADAERFAAVVKALTGEEPWVYQRSDGKIMMECYEGHLKGFMRYAELTGTIKKWLDETGR
jgi:hypothetical protein